MRAHELEITILPDATVQVHIVGVKGRACEEYVELLEAILQTKADVQHSSEYYEPPVDVTIGAEENQYL